MADTPATAATPAPTPAAATKTVDKPQNSGIVAIDSTEHKAAQGVFQTLKDKLDALGVDLKDEVKALGSLLHL